MARQVLPTPQGALVIPDVPNYSWHEYGMRVGFWRVKAALDKLRIPVTVSLNASVIDSYPEVFKAMADAKWEMMGHGFKQKAMPLVDDEEAVIRKTVDAIKNATGVAPRGWMGPGLAETWDTPDLLAAAGIEYICDWVMDDLPVPLKVKTGRMVSIPYTVETSDITMYVVQNHRSPEIFDRGKDQFDRLYSEGAEAARIMCIALHPYVIGVPHRIGYLEKLLEYITSHDDVALMTGGEILDWYDSQAQ
jgi:peptidoglycan/xylan/chitin deacetylase (PgdA/CDA1 family)